MWCDPNDPESSQNVKSDGNLDCAKCAPSIEQWVLDTFFMARFGLNKSDMDLLLHFIIGSIIISFKKKSTIENLQVLNLRSLMINDLKGTHSN